MEYEFPEIMNIRDVIPHMEGHDSFAVRDKGNYLCIDYSYDNPDQFSRKHAGWEYRRECRGLLFEPNGNIIRRPYQKFFNVNQTEETMFQTMPSDVLSKTVYLMKEDGSMVSPFVLDDKVYWGTRAGITDTIKQMEAEIDLSKYDNIVRRFFNHRITLMFEYVSPSNRIVLNYEEPKLILTGARYIKTGKYINIYTDSMFDIFEKVKIYQSNDDFASILEQVRTAKGIEGLIGVTPNGYRFKAKGEEYVFLHKSKEESENEHGVWVKSLMGELDDLLPFLEEKDRIRVIEYEKEMWNLIDVYKKHIKKLMKVAKKDYNNEPKRIATEWKELQQPEKGLVFNIINGKENVNSAVIKYMLSNVSKKERQSETKKYLNTFL